MFILFIFINYQLPEISSVPNGIAIITSRIVEKGEGGGTKMTNFNPP